MSRGGWVWGGNHEVWGRVSLEGCWRGPSSGWGPFRVPPNSPCPPLQGCLPQTHPVPLTKGWFKHPVPQYQHSVPNIRNTYCPISLCSKLNFLHVEQGSTIRAGLYLYYTTINQYCVLYFTKVDLMLPCNLWFNYWKFSYTIWKTMIHFNIINIFLQCIYILIFSFITVQIHRFFPHISVIGQNHFMTKS